MQARNESRTAKSNRLWLALVALCTTIIVMGVGVSVLTAHRMSGEAQSVARVARVVSTFDAGADVADASGDDSCVEDDPCFSSCTVTSTSDGLPCDLGAVLPYGRRFAVELVSVPVEGHGECAAGLALTRVTVSVRESDGVATVPGHAVQQYGCMGVTGTDLYNTLPGMFRQAATGL